MKTSVAILPLILAAASAAAGTPAVAQSHAGHAMPAPVRQALPEGCVARGSPTADASRIGTAGAPTCPTGAVPARLPAPAHDMSTMRQTRPAPAPASPHAGHDMSTMGQTPPAPVAASPHAGHDMSTMGQTQPAPAAASPHAGHDMSTMGQTPPAPAMPAGHDMSTMGQTQPVPAAASPHAGHDMSTMGQTQPAPAMPAGHDMSTMGQTQPAPAMPAGHDMSTMDQPQLTPVMPAGHDMSTMGQMPAGHDMSGMAMPPDVPTSANNPGRPPEAPAPAGATSGPTHAADLLFDPAEMAAARAQLRVEHGNVRTSAVIIDRLEATFANGGEGFAWDAQGWTGGDINRFWWKSEGDGAFGGEIEEAEVQALYSRAFRPFFDFQTGLRQTYRPEGDRTDLVVGVQGLAPYWFEVDAAVFLSNKGELTARAQADYDQRITNRWIIQPRAEVLLSAEDIPELRIGSGLSSLQVGARLRYEFRKEFAPYVGVEWTRSFGNTADFLEADGRSSEDTRLVVGIRAWF
ncbi:copper resistance protein B [Brevundimonas sp.]|uniref:copper resistance protein B n=1 Tax=Brevundimonas sp. TaxID=1871086 RepID=UPI00273164DA|nr:copper resistance protein B [Brevundimonas sp.]MDP1912831.1 copper resistance protein B [Brevundimonas sp.]